VRAADPDTLIVADGFSCREQISQSTSRRALHLAQVIQLALREAPHGGKRVTSELVYPSATAGSGRRLRFALLAGSALLAILFVRRRTARRER